jgi:hypothetical protein
MEIANASEFGKTHIRWISEPPEQVSERAIAAKGVAAIFAVANAWLDVTAIEIRLGFYDHQRLTEADIAPREPHHLLRLESPSTAPVHSAYRPVEAE